MFLVKIKDFDYIVKKNIKNFNVYSELSINAKNYLFFNLINVKNRLKF